MDSLILLRQARMAGLTLMVRGDRLTIRGPRRAENVARHLIANKAAILSALAAEMDVGPLPDIAPDQLSEDWREAWEERAAIMEYEARMPKERAEMMALLDTLRRMRDVGVLPKTG